MAAIAVITPPPVPAGAFVEQRGEGGTEFHKRPFA